MPLVPRATSPFRRLRRLGAKLGRAKTRRGPCGRALQLSHDARARRGPSHSSAAPKGAHIAAGRCGHRLARLPEEGDSRAAGDSGGIRCAIPDAWFGVGYHDDYPISPYGAGSDDVYRTLLDITPAARMPLAPRHPCSPAMPVRAACAGGCQLPPLPRRPDPQGMGAIRGLANGFADALRGLASELGATPAPLRVQRTPIYPSLWCGPLMCCP